MPAIGVKTAKASKGPAMTQVMTETLELRSAAIVARAADRTVIVNDEQATPVSATTCTVRGLNRRSSGGARRLTVRP